MTKDELKMLLDTGEEFEIVESEYLRRFNKAKNRFEICAPHAWYPSTLSINELLSATLKPWKPRYGDTYYYWWYYNGEWKVEFEAFVRDEIDLCFIAFGNFFKTELECLAHPEIRDRLMKMQMEYQS